MTLHSDARKLNWSMIGVIVALIIQAATLVFWGGGTGQFILTAGVDLPMVANTPYLFYCNPNNDNWYQV